MEQTENMKKHEKEKETKATAEQKAETNESVKEENVEAEKSTKTEPTEAEKAAKALAETQALAEDYKRKWYSVTAEYDNYRKRTAATASQKYAEGRADIILKILPVGDNIERALAVCGDEKMRKGLEMVKANFDKILADEGVEAFDPTGEEFDSTIAAAVAAQPVAEGEKEGMVKQTFLKGYKKGDKILRFAQVVVTK